MAASKNQRSGPKRKQKQLLCPKGHVQTHVRRVPVIGHALMLMLCECDGYAPIENLNTKQKS